MSPFDKIGDWLGQSVGKNENTDQTGPINELSTLLEERGVQGAHKILSDLGDDVNVEAMRYALRRLDSEGVTTTGLIVYRLREAAKSRFRPAGERHAADLPPSEPSPELLRLMRGVLNTPNGITREEAKPTYEAKARRLGMTVDSLIDLAMGSDWNATPVHPAFDPENENKTADYERLLG